MPEFARAGVRYITGVVPQMPVSKMSATRATERHESALEISRHANRAEAEAAIAA